MHDSRGPPHCIDYVEVFEVSSEEEDSEVTCVGTTNHKERQLDIDRELALALAVENSPQKNNAILCPTMSSNYHVQFTVNNSLKRCRNEAVCDIKLMFDDLIEKNPSLEYKMCSASRLEHIGQNDNWSCGYRSLQMLLVAIGYTDETLSLKIGNNIKNRFEINEIQKQIECAWKEGFDIAGGKSFNFKLVGKNDWIGATEATIFLRSIGVHAEIVDIEADNGANKKVLRFVEKYFNFGFQAAVNKDSNFKYEPDDSPRFPLYFQYQGHAQIIVGFEKRQCMFSNEAHCGLSPLFLNPAVDKSELLKGRGIRYFPKKAQYQIVCVRPQTTIVQKTLEAFQV